MIRTTTDPSPVFSRLLSSGQRCTALKLFFVPKRHADAFLEKFVPKIEALSVGLPDQRHGDDQHYSKVTPLPTPARIAYMKELIDDALTKGAEIVNKDGGKVVGGPESTLMIPAVLYPVTADMKVYHEEQFGPVIPVATYDDVETPLSFGRDSPYGQQVSVFGYDADVASAVVDRLSGVLGRINFNAQSGRGPDVLPFSGRRSSAMGVMSVANALLEFSIPVVVAYKKSKDADIAEQDRRLVQGLEQRSKFFEVLQ